MLPSRNEMRELEEVVEDRSINLPGSEMPLSLVSHCHGNHCAVLAVFNHAWQVGGAVTVFGRWHFEGFLIMNESLN